MVLIFIKVDSSKRKKRLNHTPPPVPRPVRNTKPEPEPNIHSIDDMEGVEFENYLYNFFTKKGYLVIKTPLTEDYGADLLLTKEEEKIAVQAKRYNQNVGITAVQEVAASKAFYGCTKTLVVTNSFYTNNAKRLAAANNVELWDRDDLIKQLPDEEEKKFLLERDSSFRKVIADSACPRCGGRLRRVTGMYGDFIGCCNYPHCHYTKQI